MNDTVEVKILRGMQASGKTTYADKFITNNQSFKRVGRDHIRHMLSNYTFDDVNEKLVSEMEMATTISIIESGYNLVIDKMNLNEKQMKKDIAFITNIARGFNKDIDIEVIEFPVPLAEAIVRDRNRKFPIGEKVLKRTWRTYEIELKDMLERSKTVYPYDHKLPYVILCDIDGTLSNSFKRRIFDFPACINDELYFPVWSVLNKYEGKVDVIIMSGRGEECRTETEQWLKNKHIVYKHLYMRKARDNRSDVIIKTELFEEHIRDKFTPMFVIDDRPCVLEEVWQRLGIFTFNVNQDARCRNDF